MIYFFLLEQLTLETPFYKLKTFNFALHQT